MHTVMKLAVVASRKIPLKPLDADVILGHPTGLVYHKDIRESLIASDANSNRAYGSFIAQLMSMKQVDKHRS